MITLQTSYEACYTFWKYERGMLPMGGWDILFIIIIVVIVVALVIFFVSRWSSRKLAEQQDLMEKNKTTVSIYVIDKKKERIQNANFPKVVHEQMPKWNKFMKFPLVKAKIGPQIVTLMCDKKVFDVLPVKKNVKVDLAGIYIVHMKGLKTKHEMAQIRRDRKGEVDSSPWYRKLIGK